MTAVSSTTDGSSASIDLTAPTLTTVSMVSDNAGDATLANAGDTVTVAEGKFKGKEGKIVQIVAGNPELKTPDLCVVKVNVASGAEFPVLPVTSLK